MPTQAQIIAGNAKRVAEHHPDTLRMWADIPSLHQTTEQRVAVMLGRYKPTMIHIGINGVWSARLADGGHMSSYEKLDYHTGCRLFLESLREAGIPFTYHGTITL